MDAGSVTTARTVIRPPQLRQRFTSTSNVRRNRCADPSDATTVVCHREGMTVRRAHQSQPALRSRRSMKTSM
jgi:hypothetical protein